MVLSLGSAAADIPVSELPKEDLSADAQASSQDPRSFPGHDGRYGCRVDGILRQGGDGAQRQVSRERERNNMSEQPERVIVITRLLSQRVQEARR